MVIAVVAAIMALGCDKEEECEKCNEAIQHMFSKIEANGCDPGRMENATKRIREDCGNDALTLDEAYIYQMAETCCLSQTVLPLCETGTASAEVEIVLRGVGPFDSGAVTVKFPELSEQNFELNDGDTQTLPFTLVQNRNINVVVQLPDLSAAELAMEQVFATFIRPVNYCQRREVVVSEVGLNDIRIDFNYWD